MAKQGFSYYMAETDRFLDIKVKRLKKRYQCEGYAVYQYVLNEIYRVEGYWLRFTEDELFDVSEYWGIEEAQVTAIVDYCAEIGLFSPELWKEKGVLTARSIQSRYMEMCKRSKKRAYIPLEYCLIETEPEQLQQPLVLPLFPEQPGVTAQPAATPAVVTPENSGKFASTPESSGNIPEKIDKEKKSKEKPSSTPPEEEAKRLIQSLKAAGVPPQPAGREAAPGRNIDGLLYQLQKLNLTPQEEEEVLRLSGHGEIGNPVWSILNEIRTSKKIKMPRLFLLSRLRAVAAS